MVRLTAGCQCSKNGCQCSKIGCLASRSLYISTGSASACKAGYSACVASQTRQECSHSLPNLFPQLAGSTSAASCVLPSEAVKISIQPSPFMVECQVQGSYVWTRYRSLLPPFMENANFHRWRRCMWTCGTPQWITPTNINRVAPPNDTMALIVVSTHEG